MIAAYLTVTCVSAPEGELSAQCCSHTRWQVCKIWPLLCAGNVRTDVVPLWRCCHCTDQHWWCS